MSGGPPVAEMVRARGARFAIRAVIVVVVVAGITLVTLTIPGLNLADAHAYWEAPAADLYGASRIGDPGAYLYSPAFAHVIAPLKALAWPAFALLWLVGSAAILYALAGPAGLLVALLPPVLMELQVGNIHLLLALAVGMSLRWPGAWAIVLLTKPTMGVGLIWWLVRREWPPLRTAVGITAVAAALSMVVAPTAWVEWSGALLTNAGRTLPADYAGVIHVPLWARLVAAVAVVTWGARSGRRWTIAVAGTLALPVLWVNGLAVLLAVPLLEGWSRLDVTRWRSPDRAIPQDR